MKCKYCKSIIENGSLYCRFCGAQLFTSQKKELSVPKPRQLSDGRWVAQIMVDGKRHTVYGNTVEEYELKARSLKAKLLEARQQLPRYTLSSAIDKYVESNEHVLSPSTLRGYSTIRRNNFQKYMNRDISTIDWQVMVNEESHGYSPKTVKNAWGLVSASLTAIDYKMPRVHLPKTAKKELPFLDYNQIQTFLAAIHGERGELAAILALHSLRESELLALTRADIHDGSIFVNKSCVPDRNHALVLKKTTKTALSTRVIPIMIPRLLEILPETGGKLVTVRGLAVRNQINRACGKVGLPLVGCHGLRRSFASLCYHLKWSERTVMQVGGWSNMQTVHNFYIKLAQMDVNKDIENMRNYYGFTKDDQQ